MNIRDPLNLRSSNSQALEYLRGSAATIQQRAVQASRRIVSSVQDTSKKFDDYIDDHEERDFDARDQTPNEARGTAMSYALPSSGPTQRHQSAAASTTSSNGLGGGAASEMAGAIGNKMSSMFGGGDRKASLPMYKDKPYQYPTSSKHVPWYARRRLLAVALVMITAVIWWSGILSFSSSPTSSPSFTFTDDKTGGRPSTKPAQDFSSLGKDKEQSSGSWFSGGSKVDWNARADMVKDAFLISWKGYEENGWGYDEYHPQAKTHRQMTPNGLGWIIVDAIDTLMIMNLTSELTHARQWLSNHSYDQDHDVNTFETTIRMIGGLLSAHYLSTKFEGKYAPVDDEYSDDMYVEMATDLADRVLGAYKTESGVPFASVNLHSRTGIPSHADGGASSTAEATTLQLEMKYLAKVTGEVNYWTKAEKIMQVIDDHNPRDGLVPIFVNANTGNFHTEYIRLGSRGDSYYEYLIKQYLQTSEQEPVYQAMWNESLTGIKKHLLTYSEPSNFLVLGEKPGGLMGELSPKVDHLVCFMPGTIALATTGGLPLAQARKRKDWGPQQEEDMELAAELMKSCWGMYKVNPTGLAAEITQFNIYEPPKMYNDFTDTTRPKSPKEFKPANAPDLEGDYVGKDDFLVKPADGHNLQRPETVESLFYMWRITGDEKYREWGWEMFKSFVEWSVVDDQTGFTSLGDVTVIPPKKRDNMESFWLAETLKYFYLLFGSNDILPLTDVVFNTEAHVFPRFELGKLFKTGWERKPRDSAGNIIIDTSPPSSTPIADVVTQTIVSTVTTHTLPSPVIQQSVVKVETSSTLAV